MRFRYTGFEDDPLTLMPRLPVILSHLGQSIEIIGLIDSGSTVNVLPYQVGIQPGLRWEEQTGSLPLVGSLGPYEAKGVILDASLPYLIHGPIRMGFAWTQAPNAPLLFGQMNFFVEFDVCFYRADAIFEVTKRSST